MMSSQPVPLKENVYPKLQQGFVPGIVILVLLEPTQSEFTSTPAIETTLHSKFSILQGLPKDEL